MMLVMACVIGQLLSMSASSPVEPILGDPVTEGPVATIGAPAPPTGCEDEGFTYNVGEFWSWRCEKQCTCDRIPETGLTEVNCSPLLCAPIPFGCDAVENPDRNVEQSTNCCPKLQCDTVGPCYDEVSETEVEEGMLVQVQEDRWCGCFKSELNCF